MFHADITLILALIALSMGAGILLKAKKYSEHGTAGCRFIAYFVIVLSLLMLLFSGFCLIKHSAYRQAYFQGSRNMMMKNKMQNKMPMVDRMSMDKPSMMPQSSAGKMKMMGQENSAR